VKVRSAMVKVAAKQEVQSRAVRRIILRGDIQINYHGRGARATVEMYC